MRCKPSSIILDPLKEHVLVFLWRRLASFSGDATSRGNVERLHGEFPHCYYDMMLVLTRHSVMSEAARDELRCFVWRRTLYVHESGVHVPLCGLDACGSSPAASKGSRPPRSRCEGQQRIPTNGDDTTPISTLSISNPIQIGRVKLLTQPITFVTFPAPWASQYVIPKHFPAWRVLARNLRLARKSNISRLS